MKVSEYSYYKTNELIIIKGKNLFSKMNFFIKKIYQIIVFMNLDFQCRVFKLDENYALSSFFVLTDNTGQEHIVSGLGLLLQVPNITVINCLFLVLFR